MASDLRAKFNEWIVIFVLLPAALSMALCLFFFWRLLHQNHARFLSDESAIVNTAFEQNLRAEALRLKTLANLPATESLITIARRRAATGGQAQENKSEAEWATANRDDMIVRSILDNDIAILFQQTCAQNSQIASLTLMDASGALMAASEKTHSYFQHQNDWWPLLRSAGTGQIISEGVTSGDTLGLVLPRVTDQGAIGAVVREEIRLDQLAAGLGVTGARAAANKVAVFLVSQHARPIAGYTNSASSAFGPALAERMNSNGQVSGWHDGFRYSGLSLDAGIYWARPAWIVAASEEGRTPWALYAPLALAFVIGCAAVFGVFVFARNLGRKLFFEPMREAAEAGIWVLRRAGGNIGGLAAGLGPGNGGFGTGSGRGGAGDGGGASGDHRGALAAAHPWSKIQYDENTPLHLELNQWFTRSQQNAEGDAAQLSIAMKHDLDLAMEFQQAFMNRPPPPIPQVYVEGRLRLEFSHVYNPALALGGDFFDIEAVGPDCAGIFVADVMGHGTRSALLTSTIRTLLKDHYAIGRNPAHFLKELNKSLCGILRDLPGQFFASACFFAADTTSRVGTYSLAGHPPPFHLHRAVGRVMRLEKPKPRGAALGAIPEEEYGADSVRLVDDDMFIFYTDGAYESTNRSGEQFGMGRLEKSIHSHIYEPTGTILKNILEDIQKFCGDEPPDDDICMVAVLVTSKPPAKS